MAAYTTLLVKDLRIAASVGVYDFEKEKEQPVIINIEAQTSSIQRANCDDINEVVSYEKLIDITKRLVRSDHFQLVETLAEEIALTCLQTLPLKNIKVRIEKPEIIPDTTVGIEIFREQDL